MNEKRQEDSSKKMSSKDMQEILVENFVGLQKAMTNLSIKFESLSDQISRLLQIFEISAKNFVQEGGGKDTNTADMLAKIDSLLEQNKTIAKGLVLMEEGIRNKSEQETPVQPVQTPQSFQQAPERFQQQMRTDRPRAKPLPRI